MHPWLVALILGIVQGLTEFLPISSSGHIEIARALLGDDRIGSQSLQMTVTLHAATALATLVVYRKDILALITRSLKGEQTSIRYILFIVLSMIPAVFVGLFFEEEVESLFGGNLNFIAAMLVVTGLLLLLSEWLEGGNSKPQWWNAIIIGISQALAIIPGISRSGATISTALICKIDRSEAAKFSFLMVIPLIFGKMAKDILEGDFTSNSIDLMPLILGALAAFATGWMACTWMIAIVQKAKLHLFAIYCFIAATLIWLI